MVLRRFFAIVCALLVFGGVSFGQPLPEPMSPPRLVNDFASVLTSQQVEALEQKLADFDKKSSTQIAVVTINDLGGYAPSDFAQRLYDKWGVGRSGKDNGVLLLLKPKTADSKGEVFISVGYGLEGVIADITAGRIIDKEMLPNLQNGDMFTAIDKATDVIINLTKGEFSADEYNSGKEDYAGVVSVGFMIICIIILITVGRRRKGGGGNGSNGSRGGGFMPPIIFGGGSHGGFGGGSFGGGGGGFGGFGGGMSGGGGGGRSW